MINENLFHANQRLSEELAQEMALKNRRIVIAESCTAGLVSGILAQVPGISKWLCGSSVTYMESVKRQWLGLDAALLTCHTAVSAEVTESMARAVLERTEAADFSVAITGHLEPLQSEVGAVAYVGLAFRDGKEIRVGLVSRFSLPGKDRLERQWAAAQSALRLAVSFLQEVTG